MVASMLQWLRIKGHLFTQERGLVPVVRTQGGCVLCSHILSQATTVSVLLSRHKT